MKKLYTLIFLLLNTALSAQPYRPMLDSINTWTYVSTLVPVNQPDRNAASSSPNCTFMSFGSSGRYFTQGDTVIGTDTCKRLFMDPFAGSNTCHQGYLREDTALRKVYFTDALTNAERLLYDFAMLPGDSIYVDGSGSQFSYFPAGYYQLDSIVPYMTVSGNTRLFYLNQVNPQVPFPEPLVWLEGIGFPGDLIYDTDAFAAGPGFFSGCNWPVQIPWYNYMQILSCFEHSQKVYFDSCAYATAVMNGCFNILDSCNYFNICGSISELSSVRNLKLQPNPVYRETELEIEMLKNEILDLSFLNAAGQQVMDLKNLEFAQGIQRRKLDVSDLPAGMYIVKLNGKNGAAFTKMLKL